MAEQSEFRAAPGYAISIEPARRRVRVEFNGTIVAETRDALVLHETRLPPVYYLPRDDVRMDLLSPTGYHTHCPFKGNASYWTLQVGDAAQENAVWSYEDPLPEVERLRDYLAFYRDRMHGWYEDEADVCINPLVDRHVHGNPLVDWMLRDAWEATSVAELVARFAAALAGSGCAVLRVNLMVRTLHPQVMGTVHVWRAETGEVESVELSHASSDEERFLSSPFVPIFQGRGGVRRRLDGDRPELDFPILRELRDGGITDYAAMPVAFSDGRVHALTLATGRPGGFSVEELGYVHEVLPLLARLVEVHALRRTARTLLDTYLGMHTGERVLEGLIRRGDGEVIPAVVWFADMRDSTALAESLPRQAYLDLLNEFFESTAGSAIEQGGEVLKFIGDAVLAIFPLRDHPDAGRRALRAAREALAGIDERNVARKPDEPVLGAAVALHVGDVNYGNIGIEGRLDFTVTGPTVNEVSRLEGLSKALGAPLVTSGAFAALVPGETRSLGTHALRGVREPIEVFAPA